AEITKLAEDALAKAKNPDVRRELSYVLGWAAMARGDDPLMADEGREKYYAEAQHRFEQAAAGLAPSAPLAARVAAARHRLDHQVIGRPADDIEGRDADGKPLKLSAL